MYPNSFILRHKLLDKLKSLSNNQYAVGILQEIISTNTQYHTITTADSP